MEAKRWLEEYEASQPLYYKASKVIKPAEVNTPLDKKLPLTSTSHDRDINCCSTQARSPESPATNDPIPDSPGSDTLEAVSSRTRKKRSVSPPPIRSQKNQKKTTQGEKDKLERRKEIANIQTFRVVIMGDANARVDVRTRSSPQSATISRSLQGGTPWILSFPFAVHRSTSTGPKGRSTTYHFPLPINNASTPFANTRISIYGKVVKPPIIPEVTSKQTAHGRWTLVADEDRCSSLVMSSPPTRPPPSPPPSVTPGSTGDPPAVETLSSDPAELAPALEDDIDQSTARFLQGAFRHTFLPYLAYLVCFTSFAKLTRFGSPYAFRATRWVADWAFWAFERVVQFVAWSGMWLGLLGSALWVLVGVGLVVAWLFIKAKPTWRRAVADRPVTTKLAVRAIGYWVTWRILRRIVWTWIAKSAIVVLLGLEAYNYVSKSTPRTPQIPNPTKPATDGGAHEVDEREGEEEAEQWARKVREEMLRDSLLRRGKSSGTTKAEDTASDTMTEKQGAEPVEETRQETTDETLQ
ncbi:uncharacterized protein JCM15063_000022 [Sporobolomyces koalae]|uniref:uncharacterized protein n=1 Tax=Sporobolomyces koalae TaxID=500713 RepID=UPI0031725108